MGAAVFAILDSLDAKAGGLSGSCSRLLPFALRGEELFDLFQRFRNECPLGSSDIENVEPCAKAMELHFLLGLPLFRLEEYAVIEYLHRSAAVGAGLANRVHEGELGAAVGGQILDEQNPLTFGHRALDSGVGRGLSASCGRSICRAIRSATRATKGMPAVSPPAMLSNASCACLYCVLFLPTAHAR